MGPAGIRSGYHHGVNTTTEHPQNQQSVPESLHLSIPKWTILESQSEMTGAPISLVLSAEQFEGTTARRRQPQ